MFRFIHAADLHLDSAFGALPPRQAARRRQESRELAVRLAEYVREHRIDAVLLAGDLFDSASAYRDTGEQLARALGRMPALVFIAPGNHDWYGPGSPWETVDWPPNVTIFDQDRITAAEVPDWNAVFHGAAFTGPERRQGFLTGYAAPQDGRIHMGVLHGEPGGSEARYAPIRREEIAASGFHYLALGHIHKRTEPERLGNTLYAWSGCLEGRGFDELGEKGFYEGTVSDDGTVEVHFVPFARHRYEAIQVDVTGRDPREAVLSALPEHTEQDLYRVTLTGTTGEQGVDLRALEQALAPRFDTLELRDGTRLEEDLWQRAGEDSLRGLFLGELLRQREEAETDRQRASIDRAARYGLAALDHRDLSGL